MGSREASLGLGSASSMHRVGQELMASSCSRGHSGWIFGKSSSKKEQGGVELKEKKVLLIWTFQLKQLYFYT